MRLQPSRVQLLLALILLSSLVLMIASARTDSATSDEGVHLFAGYTYLTQGDFRLDPEHPPLLKVLSALPLLLLDDVQMRLDARWDRADSFYDDSWAEARSLGDDFLYGWGNDVHILLFWSRLVPIGLTLVLGFAAFHWARTLYGGRAGLLAAFLILFLPITLAHGRLVNTDLGVTLFFFTAVYCFGRCLRHRNWKTLAWAGIASGLALASKYTAIILIPVLLALVVVKLLGERSLANSKSYLGSTVWVLAISFLVIWGSYGWSLKAPPPTVALFDEPLIGKTHQREEWVERLFPAVRPFIVPADYFKGLLLVVDHTMSGHDSFLLGMRSKTGWWWYFPFAILVKTPLAAFALLLAALYCWRRTRARDWFDEALLLMPAVVFLGISMTSRADLGVRHVLPIFPFVFVFAAQIVRAIDFSALATFSLKAPSRALPAMAFLISILWYAGAAIVGFPNYIAYFNELVGGAAGGHRVLMDSNLDWGQNLLRIRAALDASHLSPLHIVYAGTPALEHYGIRALPLAPEDRSIKGHVVASATALVSEPYLWLNQHPSTLLTPGVFLIEVN